jgi:primosomal replication protein N
LNQLHLAARIAGISAVRHTPAGIPAIDVLLEHESEQTEAGSTRKVAMAMKAVAFGATAEALAAQSMGSQWRFSGFLAAARGGRHPVLHIQSFVPDIDS